ncbi:cyclase family protein [Streptomonospora litoralis]|uniref:Kynurenine formamidase n=1 Tax=Streptomonospora litoralis TaxID=2498135 RepID=A0A4P6Q377_9ACTN|nr:cyclase family protein [Streptomonospora litoralis]QBI55128.1 Kynurenine formamidase [Streptomonospora litoralis]
MQINRIVDLSRPVGPETQAFPGDREPSLERSATVAVEGYNSTGVHMSSHSGTHADAPYHFLDDGPRLEELSLGQFTGAAVVVEATGRADRSPITAEDLAPWRERFAPGAAVLLHTGWADHYGTSRYFDHPYLAGDAARLLVEAGVRCVGIDAPSPDSTPHGPHPEGDWAAHMSVLGAGGTIVENLCGLERIDFADPLFVALPIRLSSGDGAPVRAVAMGFG